MYSLILFYFLGGIPLSSQHCKPQAYRDLYILITSSLAPKAFLLITWMAHPSSTEREDKEGKAKRSLEVKRKGENKQMKKKKNPKLLVNNPWCLRRPWSFKNQGRQYWILTGLQCCDPSTRSNCTLKVATHNGLGWRPFSGEGSEKAAIDWRWEEITGNRKVEWGTSLAVQWLRLCAPSAVAPGSIPGQETSSHMLQLRVHMLQQKTLHTPHATTKICCCCC